MVVIEVQRFSSNVFRVKNVVFRIQSIYGQLFYKLHFKYNFLKIIIFKYIRIVTASSFSFVPLSFVDRSGSSLWKKKQIPVIHSTFIHTV